MTTRQPAGRRVRYKGRVWTLVDLARAHGMRPAALVGRLGLGWSVAEAVETPVRPRGETAVTYRGVTDTIRGWSERTGIAYQTLYQRLRSGWPADRMFEKPRRKRAK